MSIGSNPPKPSIFDKPPINPPPPPFVAILFIGAGLVLSLALYTPFPLSLALSSLSSIFFCNSYSSFIISKICDEVVSIFATLLSTSSASLLGFFILLRWLYMSRGIPTFSFCLCTILGFSDSTPNFLSND